MTKRTVAGAVIGILVLAGVIGALVRAGGFSASSTSGPAPGNAPAARAPSGSFGATGPGTASGSQDSAKTHTLPALPQRIVKTAQVSLGLKKGTFDQQMQRATAIAATHGGFVESSQTSSGKLHAGTLVVRVPVDQFEAALRELTALGKVRGQRISGQDVTAQYVDLQARLRNWEAQERVLLGLMAKAQTIADSIKVQRELQDVQLQIEELRGQLHVLSNQTDLSTIALSMSEGPVVAPERHASTLSQAWHQAVHGFVAVIAAVVVGLGYVIPLGALALLALLAYRALRRPRVAPTA